MNREQTRLTAVSGLLFVVLLVAASALLGDLLGAFGDPDAVFEEHFSGAANRRLDVAGGYLLILSGFSFTAFVLTLHDRHRTRPDNLARGALAAGLLFSTLVVVAAASLMTVSLSIVFGQGFGDERRFSAGYAMVPQFGTTLLIVAAPLAAAVYVAGITLICRDRFPAALTAAGALCAVILLFSVLYLPFLALPLWVLVTLIWGLPRITSSSAEQQQ